MKDVSAAADEEHFAPGDVDPLVVSLVSSLYLFAVLWFEAATKQDRNRAERKEQ